MKLAARCCSVCYPPNRNAHVQSFSQQAMSPQVFFFLADRQLSVAIGPHRAIVADAVLEFVVLLQIGGVPSSASQCPHLDSTFAGISSFHRE